ncbi:Protein C2-DOMAIN ABA-RELATED 9, partial [Mucuna pruriens]
MGDADIDLKPYVQSMKMGSKKLPNGCALKRIKPDRINCLAEESSCIWQDGNVVQEMFLRLRNVESGEVAVEIEWVDVVGCRGLSHKRYSMSPDKGTDNSGAKRHCRDVSFDMSELSLEIQFPRDDTNSEPPDWHITQDIRLPGQVI